MGLAPVLLVLLMRIIQGCAHLLHMECTRPCVL